jgi:hypothetical protein
MFDGQEMLAIHGDDGSVPNLADENLKNRLNMLYAAIAVLHTLGLYFTPISPVTNSFA